MTQERQEVLAEGGTLVGNQRLWDDHNVPVRQFYLEEFKCLRQEIENRSQEQRTTERYAIVAIAAIYAFLIKPVSENVDSSLASMLWLLWWLPFGLAVFGFSRWYDNVKIIINLAAYIKIIEARLTRTEYGGWEHFLAQAREKDFIAKLMDLCQKCFGSRPYSDNTTKTALLLASPWSLLFWFLLCATTLFLAGWHTWHTSH